mmetsp:Transcript_25888/g.40181  ORF Transcript_25888/g.40181 Transcript_25888/m.40181 type:complete len:256 (+) Transcript_25888:128-895(+)|eukprot:CAMPEP_0196806352 /NCGR_PEP_ID=MMETSP1362-20130617/6254_1 /TAXON_ID=163516 /ORGANISM="Leptocylindrus danicus, Strain CCMP1856" /LENGTH=255 /DNA_ID=CAMNT_0042179795 /DNA_START=102 /DNA_END=869 /DNA_ORIENTATION=-
MIRTVLRNSARSLAGARTIVQISNKSSTSTKLLAPFQLVANPQLQQQHRSLSSYRITVPPEHCTPIKEGDAVPEMEFVTRVRIESDDENPFDWKIVPSSTLFKGKRVVLFALPGAFTPTCSSTHLPGYEAAYDEIVNELDVDEVYCLSVNDAFVMRSWGLNLGLTEDKTPGANGFEKVKLLPDGAAEFTRGMGMSTMWDVERGFGERSWRYSCVVHDGKVEKMFIEGGGVIQNSKEDPFECSDAGTMVEYLKSVM